MPLGRKDESMNFDDIEQKPNQNIEISSNKNSSSNQPVAEKLSAEIENQNKSRMLKSANAQARADEKNSVKNFAKSQKPKKSLKKRILAWALGIGIFAGAAAGAGIAISKNQSSPDEDYQSLIKSRYELVDETLTSRLNQIDSSTHNKQIQTIQFEEPGLENVELIIKYEGLDKDNDEKQVKQIYNVLLDYYNSLVDAEESGNMISYLDALNAIFENMQFVNKDYQNKCESIKFEDCDEDASEKINNLLGLEAPQDGVIKQVAFLPLTIEVADWTVDGYTDTFYFTFKLSGISYCETTAENHDEIKQDSELVSDKTYNKNNIKAYYRDIELSSSFVGFESFAGSKPKQLIKALQDFVNGELTEDDFTIATTYFGETNIFENPTLFDEFLKMKAGNFDYTKPEGLDLGQYK